MVVKFIIGSAPCLIPPLDRYDQYSCEPDPVTDPGIFMHENKIYL